MTRMIVNKGPVTGTIVTKSGARLTQADIERLADELKAGIDLSGWIARPVGRPHLDPESGEHSPRIEVRVPASLHRRVRERAAVDGRTVSQVVRNLLQDYVDAATASVATPPRRTSGDARTDSRLRRTGSRSR